MATKDRILELPLSCRESYLSGVELAMSLGFPGRRSGKGSRLCGMGDFPLWGSPTGGIVWKPGRTFSPFTEFWGFWTLTGRGSWNCETAYLYLCPGAETGLWGRAGGDGAAGHFSEPRPGAHGQTFFLPGGYRRIPESAFAAQNRGGGRAGHHHGGLGGLSGGVGSQWAGCRNQMGQ